MTQPQSSEGKTLVMKRSHKGLGWVFLLAPLVGLFSVMFAYALSSFVITSLISPTTVTSAISATTTTDVASSTGSLGVSDVRLAVGSLIHVFLGLLGIVCVLGAMVGIPLGIIFLLIKVPVDESRYDARSGEGSASMVLPEIKRWSWGGFGLTWIWGVAHGVWISLLTFIPFVGLIVRLYLGFKGNELAWKKNKWESVEAFHKNQKAWGIVGGILFFLSLWPFYVFLARALMRD